MRQMSHGLFCYRGAWTAQCLGCGRKLQHRHAWRPHARQLRGAGDLAEVRAEDRPAEEHPAGERPPRSPRGRPSTFMGSRGVRARRANLLLAIFRWR